MEIAKKTYNLVKENLDFKKGAIFGGLAGVAVGLINLKDGLEYAFYSGSKEIAKCFVVGSLNMGVCRKLATTIESKPKALAYATVIPAIMSTALTYGVHAYFQGTPNPVESTLPTLLSAPFFLGLAVRERKLSEKRKGKELEGLLESD